MQKCVDRALDASRNGDENGIAAMVVKDGEVIGIGANTVEDDLDATRHAEINAIAEAGKKLGSEDLTGCILYSSLQPCEMCLAAACFAGIHEIYFSAEKSQVAGKYFQFPALGLDDFQKASKSPLTIMGGMLQDQVIRLYADGEE